MSFRIRKISGKYDPLSSSLDNFLKKIAVRPENEMPSVYDQQGQQNRPAQDYLEYLETNYPGDPSQPVFEGIEFTATDILKEFSIVYEDVVSNVNLVKKQIVALINKLKGKNGIRWDALDKTTQKLFEKSFNLEGKSLAFRNVEVFPFDSQERDLMDEIGGTVFSPLNMQLEKDDLGHGELASYEFGGVSGYGPAQRFLSEILGQKISQISYEISSRQDISDDEKKQLLEQAKAELKSKQAEIYAYLEDYGGDVLGLDIDLLDGLSIDFSKPGLLSRGELDRMIFSLESMLNNSSQMAGTAPSTDPYKSERFFNQNVDEENPIPAPGQQDRYDTEKEMQLGWTSLIEPFSGDENAMREAQAFLANYGLSLNDVISINLPDFDSKNPPPPNTKSNAYNNWMRRKFIEFVKTSRAYAPAAGAKLLEGPEFDIFPENIADAMIGINAGITTANQAGLASLDFTFEKPYQQFPGLARFVQTFMGNINDIYRRFNIDPNQDYSSNAERLRIKELIKILIELNNTSNRINDYIQSGENIGSFLTRDIVSLRDNAEKFFQQYEKQIGITSDMDVDKKQQKYKEMGSPISVQDLINLNGSISSQNCSVAVSLLNKLDDSARTVSTVIQSLKRRVSIKQEKEIVTELKNSAVALRTFLKNMGIQEDDYKQLNNLLLSFRENVQAATPAIQTIFGASKSSSKLVNSLRVIILTLTRAIERKDQALIKDSKSRLTLAINLLKEASDEHLGITEASLNSEEEERFRNLQRAINSKYEEILQISGEEDSPEKIQQMREMGEEIVSYAKDALKNLEGMLSDFLNLDSSEKIANVSYRNMQSAIDELPKLFNEYGDYRLSVAETEALDEYDDMVAKSEKREIKRKINTESGFDEDNQILTFYDIIKTKTGVERESRSYEIGDPRLERALKERKLIRLQPEENSNFMRAYYKDTYIDPADLKKAESDPFTVDVVYSVPQNPSVLNRIVQDLKISYDSGEIQSSKDIRDKLDNIASGYNSEETFGKQVNNFISGLLSANQDTETISRDLFDSLVISDIDKNFRQYSEMLGNPFLSADNLDIAIDKAIQMGKKNPRFAKEVQVLQRMKADPKLKKRLIDYHLNGNVFSTDITREKRQPDSAYNKLIKSFPEIESQIDIAMQSLPDNFVFDKNFVKLVSDAVNNKKEEQKYINTPQLLSVAQENTKNSLQTLITYVHNAAQEGRSDGLDSDEEREVSIEDLRNDRRFNDDVDEPEDEESWEGESFDTGIKHYDQEQFPADYQKFVSRIVKKLLKDKDFQMYRESGPEIAETYIESVADSIDEEMLSQIKELGYYGYSVEKLTGDVLDQFNSKFKKRKSAFNLRNIQKEDKVVFNLKRNRKG